MTEDYSVGTDSAVRVPLSTLANLKNELLDLYGEDQVAAFAAIKARRQIEEWLKSGSAKTDGSMLFGEGDPNDPAATADYSLNFAELLQRFDPADQYAKAVRARLIVFAYTLWEKVYRPAIKQECGIGRVDSDVFGDLRLYRNAILHKRASLDAPAKVLTVFAEGDLIEPTADQLREVFKQLVVGLNDIGIRYYGEDPGFVWGHVLTPG
ncbi:MAG: hypothetical protein OXE81_08125 [Gammaproteobacteria bacterium]|nr:hypothetical protein [Gammaproteobacteria bacterium]